MKVRSLLLLVALVTCTPSERQAADRTAQDVCRLIAPNTDAGESLFLRLVADVEELTALQRAAIARDAGARDAKGDHP